MRSLQGLLAAATRGAEWVGVAAAVPSRKMIRLAGGDTRLYQDGMIKGRPPRLSQIFQTYTPPLYFVTLCTLRRQAFHSLAAVHESFTGYAKRAQSFNVAVGRYVIMPDHLHLFVRGDQEFGLAEWVKGLKRAISDFCRSEATVVNWQPGFFDHVLRNDESYALKWNYVRDNPIRAGLIAKAEEWPYAGEIVVIDRA